MAPFLETAHGLGWILLKALLRFTFMFINNCVAIPSYCLYLLVLQPLRIMDSQTFWYIEGVMFRWLLAMVSSWGWAAGYTGSIKGSFQTLTDSLKAPYGLHTGSLQAPYRRPSGSLTGRNDLSSSSNQ
ncbi:hypothetical protein NFI96_004489 [Prochilodus magdalenae]|nr:hypothetical protein NFI96_004489 [Prochilodus magdalenae]